MGEAGCATTNISYFDTLDLNDGIVQEIRLQDKISHQEKVDLIVPTDKLEVVELVKMSKAKPAKKSKKSKLDQVIQDSFESSGTNIESSGIEGLAPPKITNKPRKYLTAKEKQNYENWIDRSVVTDWQDKDCWLMG
jgi:hypothetical protein